MFLSMIRALRKTAGYVTDVEIYLAALLTLLAVVSTRALPYVLIAYAVLWPVRWLARGRPSVGTAADWGLGLLLVMTPVTLWATAIPETTRPQVYRLLMGIALYFSVVNWADSARRLRLMVGGLMALALLLVIVALLAVAWGNPRWLPAAVRDLSRMLPIFGDDTINPNIMAGTLALLWPCALAPVLFNEGRWRWLERVGGLLISALIIGVAIAARSRGAIIALGAAFVVLIALRWRRGWLAALLGALASGAVVWRIGLTPLLDAVSVSGAMTGFDSRLEIWSRALYMIQDFSFTGVGIGSFQMVANLLYPFFLAGPDAAIPHAHNIFLQVAVDLGLPGLIAWLSVLLTVVMAAWHIYQAGRRTRKAWQSGLGAGLLGSQVVLMVHGLTDATTWGTRPAVIVWGVWGLALAGWRVHCGVQSKRRF